MLPGALFRLEDEGPPYLDGTVKDLLIGSFGAKMYREGTASGWLPGSGCGRGRGLA